MGMRDTEDLPDDEKGWKERLTDEQYRVLREKGTETAGSGDLLEVDEDGVFSCAGCGQELFDSDHKFHSGSGWPSFSDVKDSDRIELRDDSSMGMQRTEVICARCGGHLGHVFDDGPEPTGKRYCINSAALEFDESEAQQS